VAEARICLKEVIDDAAAREGQAPVDTDFYFVIHRVGDNMSERGAPVELGHYIQLQHLLTGLYIALDDSGGMGLTDAYMDPSTVLSAEDFLNDGEVEKIEAGTYLPELPNAGQFFIGARDGEGWLSFHRGEVGAQVELNPIREVKVISAQQRNMSLGEHAFRAELIKEKTLAALANVENCCLALRSILDRIQQQPPVTDETKAHLKRLQHSGDVSEAVMAAISSHDPAWSFLKEHAEEMRSAFHYMVNFCSADTGTGTPPDPFTSEDPPHVMHQAMFGQFNSVALTVEWISAVISVDHPWYTLEGKTRFPTILHVPAWAVERNYLGKPLHEACLLAFRFLKQVIRENSLMKDALAKHLEFLACHLSGLFKANDTYGQLLKNNRKLLHSLRDEDVEHVAAIIAQTQNAKGREGKRGARFVVLLRMMCKCDGQPVRHAQIKVLDAFLNRNRHLIPTVKHSSEGLPSILMPSGLNQSEGEEWFPVDRFRDREGDILRADIWDNADHEKMYRFHLMILGLMADLCLGRNRHLQYQLLLLNTLSPYLIVSSSPYPSFAGK